LTANTIKWKPFLINNFFILNVFEVKESNLRCFSKLPCLSDFENPGQLPVSEVLLGYCRLSLMDFSNFFIPDVSDVKESVYRSFTRPLCSCDPENKGQLPVLQELEGNDNLVL